MKKLLLIFCLSIMSHCFSQAQEKVTSLEYATIEIEVPKNCVAKSKNELSNCDGISAQWMYVSPEMLRSTSSQLIKKWGENATSKEPIEVISYGATLKGYKFTYKNKEKWNRMIVYGNVNKQPLVLNVASEDELIAICTSNAFLKKLLKIKM